MKRYSRLYPQIYDFQNLLRAARLSQRGKRFRPDVACFHLNLEKELYRLQIELKEHTYRHGAYRQFPIYEGKKRMISSAPYRDRVVHHALCNVIEPRIDKTFIYDSYACRKGKGTHAAVDRLTGFIRTYPYALKIDIQKYFPTIRHDVLLSILNQKIKDEEVMGLLSQILASYEHEPEWDERGNLLFNFEGAIGIPIGNLTSQFFANVYLNPFDHFVKEKLKCRGYVRYVDDFVLFANSKAQLNHWRRIIKQYLSENLGLSIHEQSAQAILVEYGIDFMGYRVFQEYRKLRNGNGYRFLKRFQKMKFGYQRGEKTLQTISQSVVSWIGHVAHADSWGLRTVLLRQSYL